MYGQRTHIHDTWSRLGLIEEKREENLQAPDETDGHADENVADYGAYDDNQKGSADQHSFRQAVTLLLHFRSSRLVAWLLIVGQLVERRLVIDTNVTHPRRQRLHRPADIQRVHLFYQSMLFFLPKISVRFYLGFIIVKCFKSLTYKLRRHFFK